MNSPIFKSSQSPYVTHVTTLFNVVSRHPLSHASVHLYVVLLAEMNRSCWPETYGLSDRMMALKAIMSVRTLVSARQELMNVGVIDCHIEGTGSQTRCVYRFLPPQVPSRMRYSPRTEEEPMETPFPCESVMSNDSTNDARLLKGTGVLKTKDKEEDEEKEREKEKTESLPLSQIESFLMNQREWASTFCSANNMTSNKLHRHIKQFVLQLQNQGIKTKEKADAVRHFGAWYNRMNLQQFQEQEKQLEAQERYRAEEEARRQEEIRHKQQMEEESKASYRRLYAEMKRKEAEGDPKAIAWMNKYRDVIV